MSKYNKTINTNILEQIKSGLIIALVFTAIGGYIGIQYQKNNTVTVKNTVMVQSASVEAKK